MAKRDIKNNEDPKQFISEPTYKDKIIEKYKNLGYQIEGLPGIPLFRIFSKDDYIKIKNDINSQFSFGFLYSSSLNLNED